VPPTLHVLLEAAMPPIELLSYPTGSVPPATGDPVEDTSGCECCQSCGNPTPDDDITETVHGSIICSACRAHECYRCDYCNGWNPDGSPCGNGCDEDGRGGLVHDYGYKPHPDFFGTGPLHLGMELEIETTYRDDYRAVEVAHRELGEIGYLKDDSSIGHGFELVTHPLSYPWAIAHFPWTLLTRLARLGCSTPDSTGLHVHLSRAAFDSPSHTYRWMKFIHRNEEPLTRLARRATTEYAAFTDEDRRAIKAYVKGAGSERDRAINTGNRDTYELRIFASSLEPEQVQAAIGFAAASVEYTRTLTVADIAHHGAWTWPAFATWVAGQPDYRPLAREIGALPCAL
jgi:hypothetical protein